MDVPAAVGVAGAGGYSSAPGIPAPRTARHWLVAHWATLSGVFLLAVLATTLLSTLSRKTLTIDEYLHIPAGFAYLHGDFRPNSEHPQLAKLLAALPLVPLGLKGPFVVAADSPQGQTQTNAKLFWRENQGQFAAISFWTRVPMIALTVALGALLFGFARALCGPRAAVLALAIFALDDTRAPLPYDLPPGESVRLHLLITAPSQPGDYWLDLDLVQEGVSRFGDRGSTPRWIAVRVVP